MLHYDVDNTELAVSCVTRMGLWCQLVAADDFLQRCLCSLLLLVLYRTTVRIVWNERQIVNE